jgi:hypothetical protein
VADVLMLPLSITHQPYRSQFKPTATHVGVALFAALPEAPDTTVNVPAANSGEPPASTDG